MACNKKKPCSPPGDTHKSIRGAGVRSMSDFQAWQDTRRYLIESTAQCNQNLKTHDRNVGWRYESILGVTK